MYYHPQHRSLLGPFLGTWLGVTLLYWLCAAFITDGQATLPCLAVGPTLALLFAWVLTVFSEN